MLRCAVSAVLRSAIVATPLLLTGCGAADGADVQTTADEVEATGPLGAKATTPLDAPKGQWTWLDVPGTACANGSQTGVGVNLTNDSDDVLIFLEGGGACWDGTTCWGPVQTSFYVATGYGHLEWDTDPQRAAIYLLDADDTSNPFHGKNIVYVPYCTGDVHAGSAVRDLSFLGWHHQTHFKGYDNLGVILSRVKATLPKAKHVWLAGDSAGGFGAAFNFGRVQDTFPKARVDVIDDSGQPIQPDPGRWQTWRDLWNMQLPPDCDTCKDGPGPLVDYFRQKYPKSHVGLISFDYDVIISPFMGLSLGQFHDELSDLLIGIDKTWPTAHYYVLPAASHVGLATPTPGLKAWVKAMVDDDPSWKSKMP